MSANVTCSPATVVNMSELCMGLGSPPIECDAYHVGSTVAIQVVNYANMLVGVWGNLLTMMAIPYAMHKRRFGFQSDNNARSSSVTHLHILHLAFVDFLFCLTSALVHLMPLFKRGWPFGRLLCALSVFFRYALNFGDCAQLALIALSRSVFLSCPRLFEAIFAGRAAIGSPLAIWVFIALWVANGFSTGDLRFVGFNCMTGTCSLIKNSRHISASMSVSVIAPLAILVLSNISIWKAVRRSSANFNQSGSAHLQSQLSAREQRMTRMVGIMCISYTLSNFAGITIKILDPSVQHAGFSYASKLIFYAKYSVNFVIYCASNTQYREAYLLFLGDIAAFLRCKRKIAAHAEPQVAELNMARNVNPTNTQQQ